jgi:hypothetical protein
MILPMSPLFFDISISEISNVGCFMFSKLLLFAALVEASEAEGRINVLVFLCSTRRSFSLGARSSAARYVVPLLVSKVHGGAVIDALNYCNA